MKRILALLLSLFTAITNNIDYQAQGDMPYQDDVYYTIDEGSAPDYRDLYGTNPVGSADVSCHPRTFKGSGEYLTYSDGKQHTRGVWIVNREGMNFDSLPDSSSYTFENDVYIIMPFTGVLRTSSKTSTGHTMILSISLDGQEYRIDIQNMERWWCCLGKDKPDAQDALGNSVWVHTCGELLDTQIRQGYVLGMAQAGTTVNVALSDGTPVTWKEFYNH